ncbi:UNVERIFIED_ORG: hypothetical protein FHW05_004792 [Pantoea agglomerans]
MEFFSTEGGGLTGAKGVDLRAMFQKVLFAGGGHHGSKGDRQWKGRLYGDAEPGKTAIPGEKAVFASGWEKRHCFIRINSGVKNKDGLTGYSMGMHGDNRRYCPSHPKMINSGK